MKHLITFLTSTLRMAVIAFALSTVFTGGQWMLSFLNICDTPSWSKFLWGGFFLFAIMFIYASYKAIVAMIKYKKERKEAVEEFASYEDHAFTEEYYKLESFKKEIERYSRLQEIASTYMLFKFYIDDKENWEFAEEVENVKDWIILHPYPFVAPEQCYFIKYTGDKNLSSAVDEMLEDFMSNKENEGYRQLI